MRFEFVLLMWYSFFVFLITLKVQKNFSAALAHLVEQLICNHQVVSSIPTRGTTAKNSYCK